MDRTLRTPKNNPWDTEMSGLDSHRLSLDMALTFGRQFIAGFFQLLIILLISRLLGPEGAGVYVVVLLLPTLLSQLLNLGLAPANVFFVASEQFDLTQVWAANRNIVLAMSLFGLAIGCAIVHFVGATIFPEIDTSLLFLALLIYPASLMNNVLTSLYQAKQNFRSFNVLVLAQPAIVLLLLIILWSTSVFSLLAVIIATAVAHAATFVLGLLMIRKSVEVLLDQKAPMITYARRCAMALRPILAT